MLFCLSVCLLLLRDEAALSVALSIGLSLSLEKRRRFVHCSVPFYPQRRNFVCCFVVCSVGRPVTFTGRLSLFVSCYIACSVGLFVTFFISGKLRRMAPALPHTLSPSLITSSPSLKRRSRFVAYYVAFSSQQMALLCLLNYPSLCRLLGPFLTKEEAALSVALPVASSPSQAKRS
jgi:hypothetical protein